MRQDYGEGRTTRTYKVIEEQKLKQNVTYELQSNINTVGSLSLYEKI